MIMTTDAETRALAQEGTQPTPDHLVELYKGLRSGLLEVAEPAAKRPVEVGDDHLQALPSCRRRASVRDVVLSGWCKSNP